MIQLGIFDLFRRGVGPSSSHTVGPMRAGNAFAKTLQEVAEKPSSISVDLYGSLAATGIGHGTDRAVLLGLGGAEPETVPIARIDRLFADVRENGSLTLATGDTVPFDLPTDMRFHPRERLDFHVNALTIHAEFSSLPPLQRTYYSIGGGFVLEEGTDGAPHPLGVDADATPTPDPDYPHPFTTGVQMVSRCHETGLSVAQLALENELACHSLEETEAYLDMVMATMFQAIEDGATTQGVLPGGLQVPRRAVQMRTRLEEFSADPLELLDWVTLYALAVNEENAAGHRVVTAPTNGASGVIPAVLGHFLVTRAARMYGGLPDLARKARLWKLEDILALAPELRQPARDFLLAAAAVGSLIKVNASFAGAEVGCQGEVGSASAMAAAGLAQALGGSPEQVENAAEIAMEHSLGLTCDPVAGLVQIPCIERNAVAAVKAISAARMAMYGDGRHQVSLDVAIETMRQTGVDMLDKYKETSVGGLAVNVVEC